MTPRATAGRRTARRHPVAAVALTVVAALAAAGCAGDGGGDGAGSTAPTSTTTTVAGSSTSAATTSAAATTGPSSSGASSSGPSSSGPAPTPGPGTTGGAAPITPDPSWRLFETPYRVYGIAAGDVLNVRTGPGVANPVITALAFDARGVRVYSPGALAGEAVWMAVQVPGGAGWVNARYLRPEGPERPEVVGTPAPAVAEAATAVVAAMQRADFAALGALVDPVAGVRFSAYAYVSEEDPRFTAQQIARAASDSTVHLWGYTDGEGAPIERTIARRIADIAGSTALTSTQAIGYDVTLGKGNSLNNLAEVYPLLPVVEYHFAGTCCIYDGLDWQSVRLVFNRRDGAVRLVAVVQDMWTI